jgi:hypothetical protein
VRPESGQLGWPVPGQQARAGARGGRDGGLAIVRSTVYNVCMAMRAMQEATFMILTALASGSQHGYGIITDVQEISGGRIRLRPGTCTPPWTASAKTS